MVRAALLCLFLAACGGGSDPITFGDVCEPVGATTGERFQSCGFRAVWGGAAARSRFGSQNGEGVVGVDAVSASAHPDLQAATWSALIVHGT